MKSVPMNKLRNTLLILFSVLATISSLFFGMSFSTASADEQDSPPDVSPTPSIVSEFYLPETPLEYKELSSPVDVYYSGDLTAIAEDKQLYVYKDGKYIDTSSLSFTSIKQVKRFGKDTLLVSDNGTIYSVNIITGEKTIKYDSLGGTIGGNYFDISNNYLITTYSTNAFLYSISGETFSKSKTLDNYRVLTNSPIAINNNNQVFFVDDSGIKKLDIGSGKTAETLYKANPDKMIADTDHVYYIEDSNVVKVNISDGEKTDLTFSELDSNYTLGSKIILPKVIAFKGENLLLTDASSVQEFKIDNNQLVFTGFAIAGKRSAFNRIGTTASEIEKYGDTIAVLDQFKLTVFKNTGEDYYSRDNFDNYLADDLGGDGMPSAFALGNGTALLIHQQNITSSTLRFLDLTTGKPDQTAHPIFDSNIIRDVCYQSGYYYVLVSNGSSSSVYKYDELTKEKAQLKTPTLGNEYQTITVDVFGNVYLSTTNGIYKLNKANGYSRTSIISASGIKKLSTDLSGKLFVLTSNGLNYVQNGELVSVYTPSLTDNLISSFAMDYISEDVYFIYESEELVSKSLGLNNLAISSATVPNDYAITGNEADLSAIKVYTTKTADTNVYSVTSNGKGFDYNGLIKGQSDYLFICDVKISDDLTMSALAGQAGVVLINKTEIKAQSLTFADAPSTAYVTTDVNMYYLPLITKNAEFSLSNENSIVRLTKSTAIFPTKTFTYLDREYYFASAEVNGTTYKGYVPVAFTVEVLAENFVWDEYTLEEVTDTTVFSDAELTQKLFDVHDGQKVHVITNENGICEVSFKSEDGTLLIGYIESSALKSPQNIAIRNVIIIMALAVCAFGTTLFLTLRKSK